MPELPEVQTIVNDLNRKIIGRKIIDVWFDWPKMISIIFADKRGKLHKTTRKAENFRQIFKKELSGLKIKKIERRGKNILIYLIDAGGTGISSVVKNPIRRASEYILLIHQKMTGHLLVGKWRIQKARPYGYKIESLLKGPLQEKNNSYIHLIFYFDNGWQMALSDLRKFAKVLLGVKEKIENLPELKKLGPDALDKKLSFKKFKDIIGHVRGKIKQTLMNQEIISGIGNIYSDEALFLAKINPFKLANKLTEKEIKNLYLAIRQVLKKAIRLRGTSISDFRDASGKAGKYSEVRLVYRKEKEPCPRCRTLIKRIKIAGRSAYFCPSCQSE